MKRRYWLVLSDLGRRRVIDVLPMDLHRRETRTEARNELTEAWARCIILHQIAVFTVFVPVCCPLSLLVDRAVGHSGPL